MDPDEAQRRWREALIHLNFCVQVYKLQIEGGRYFLHEHPTGASSWQMPSIESVLRKHGVIRTKAHQCAYNLMSKDGEGVGLAYKPTSFMTNAPFIAEELQRRCTNTSGGVKHRHVQLVNGRARKAQEYPDQSCEAICRGIMNQKHHDERGEFLIGILDMDETNQRDIKEAGAESDRLHDDHDSDMIAVDDVTGALLDVRLVKEAREAEMRYFRRMGVYRKVPIRKCIEQTGKMPIGVRWVDVNKQDNENPKYRSRL
eukprot:1713512-Karenia_brevis.AAC.1